MQSKRYRKWFKHWRILLTLPFVKNCVAIKIRLNFQHLELNAWKKDSSDLLNMMLEFKEKLPSAKSIQKCNNC